jgi:Rrf2 family protein
MKLITRDTDYAIRALRHIACRQEDVVSVTQLVKDLKVPRPFLRKALQLLEKRGLLRSYKGKGGGFALAISPKKIFILDVARVFQGPFKLNECYLKKHVCPNTKICVLKKKIDAIERQIVQELKRVSIASLY